ncbi:MAG: hypothetical protein LBH20_01555 [Treponema sp.]|jgi:hypothetical protein|nr:hypothetical protein [Treponema sp.]
MGRIGKLTLLAVAFMFILACNAETSNTDSSTADLLEISIGSGKITNIRLGYSATEWKDASNLRAMRTMDLELADAAAMADASIVAKISDKATAQFACISDDSKPASFSAETTWSFAPNDFFYIRITSQNKNNSNYYRVRVVQKDVDVRLDTININYCLATLGSPGRTTSAAAAGSVTVNKTSDTDAIIAPAITAIVKNAGAETAFAVGASPADGDFSAEKPAALSENDVLWVRVTVHTGEDTSVIFYYKINIKFASNNTSFGESDPEWGSDDYNMKYRMFPNAPSEGILTYPWGSGTDNYFDRNAQPSVWNTRGHNHKYPDLFHFANGKAVKTIADWENRRKEISAILQYYMHGRMPSIDPSVLEITWADNPTGNTCVISLKHIQSGRTATMNVTHTPPSGAVQDAQARILAFGVGAAPSTANRPGWGVASFNTAWGGTEADRSGLCATLYGFNVTDKDTPSVNMEYAWAMSVVLTVIEEGGLKGYYNPAKVSIYGFSRSGKAALCISAFAQARGGTQIGMTFVGSSGSGGAAIDRWIAPFAYKDFAEDPLPVDGVGATRRADLKGTTWFYHKIEDEHNSPTSIMAMRGWETTTPGIPAGSHIYGEYNPDGDGSFTRRMGLVSSEGWYQIQPLAQARSETRGWFSARFQDLQDLHNGLALDSSNPSGVLCTMPFDAHFIAALVAPRIIMYEDGYDCLRTNPESQWANWLMCDEIYQMYAEELKDPSIIWRNLCKFYNIDHVHRVYQDQDEYDVVTAIFAGQQPNAKFRTSQFPIDDPRYRWDFNRVDWGRPGHPSIAERVRLMRESPYPVKTLSLRGLLDTPERL